MTILSIGSTQDRTHESHGTLGMGTVSLAERMRLAELDGPAGTEEPEEEFDSVKFMFDMLFAEYQQNLQSGNEEETGMVTLEVNF